MARTRGIIRKAGDVSESKDALPWLQTADDAYDDQPVLDRKWLFLGAGVFLAALIGTVWFFYTQADPNRHSGPAGEPPLILADPKPFKKHPEDSAPTPTEDEVDKVATGNAGSALPNVAPEAAPPESLMDPATIFGTASREAAAASKTPDLPPPDTADIAPPRAKAAPAVADTAALSAPTPGQKTAQAKPQPAPEKATPEKSTAVKPAPAKPAPEKPAVQKTIEQPAAAPKPTKPGVLLQLGAFSSTARANQGWGEISGKFRSMTGLSPDIAPVTVGGRTMYRLRAAGISGQTRADQICAELKAAGQPCLIVTQ